MGDPSDFTLGRGARIKKEIRATVGTLTFTVKIPMVPNFIIVEELGTSYPIGKFPDKVLKQIGKEWTKKLIESATKRRKAHP